MTFHPFRVEEFMSAHEQGVDYHLAESGVEPVKLGELLALAGDDGRALLDTPLNYPEVNGEVLLRETIAARYPTAGAGNVLVTVGASEANYITAETLLEPGDEIIVLKPAYLQAAGVARNRGASVKVVELDEGAGWRLDPAALEEALSERTKLIAVINPGNPTGHILAEDEIDALLAAAERTGAWLLVDEVYAGAERESNRETPTLYGRYDKTVAVGSMSKAYGLPGLRLGWAVAPEELVEDLWRRHEYTTISAGMLSNRLARLALSDDVRPKLIDRTRGLIRRGHALLQEMLSVHPGVFSVVPSGASAMNFVKYDLPVGSTDFALRLLSEKGVLVVPGDCFEIDHHLRISSALPPDYVRAGLTRMNVLVAEILAAA